MINMAEISLNWYPIYDQNSWKIIPFGAAHTHIAHIREYPSGFGGKSTRQFRTRSSLAIQRTRKSRKWTYLTWDSFVFSLNKSLDFSLLRTDCYNILPIQNRCYKNPDKPWGFKPTHQNSFKYNFSLNAFLGTQNLSYFHDRQLLHFRPHFEQVSFAKDSRGEFAKSAPFRVLYICKNRNVHDFHWSGMIGNMV